MVTITSAFLRSRVFAKFHLIGRGATADAEATPQCTTTPDALVGGVSPFPHTRGKGSKRPDDREP
jgi:hypothetical protein